MKPLKMIINVETGEISNVEMTDEEIAQSLIDAQNIQAPIEVTPEI